MSETIVLCAKISLAWGVSVIAAFLRVDRLVVLLKESFLRVVDNFSRLYLHFNTLNIVVLTR